MIWRTRICAIGILISQTMPCAVAGEFSLEYGPFETISTMRGNAHAPKVGNIMGADLTISFSGDNVAIEQSTAGGGKQIIASGNAFGLKVEKENDEATKLHGYCLLSAGEKLPEIIGDKISTADLIFCIDGQKFAGTIMKVENGVLSMREAKAIRLIRVSDISSIASAHVLKISGHMFKSARNIATFPAVETAKILRFDFDETLDDFMTAAGKRKLETAIDAAGYTKVQRAALIGASVLITGAAIAVPVAIAVPLAGRHQTAQKAPPSNLEGIQR